MGSGASRRTARRHRWAGALLVLAFGIVGALVGWTAAMTIEPPEYSTQLGWVFPLAVLAAVVAGPLAGVFAGLLLVRGLRREAVCPRCGTANHVHAGACVACDLALIPERHRS
jgi:MFS family permease